MKALSWSTFFSILQLIVIIGVVFFDILVPTLVILAILLIYLLINKDHIAVMGFRKDPHFVKLVIKIFTFSILWSLFHLSVTMPLLNHVTGTTQNLSSFVNLKGNFSQLLIYLFFSWTLAAVGEEVVYRGFIPKIVTSIVGTTQNGVIAAVVLSSVLFGLAHTEQGQIGVILTFLDALFFSYLKRKYHDNLWAPILAHGFNNSIGLITFYFVGPIYGFW